MISKTNIKINLDILFFTQFFNFIDGFGKKAGKVGKDLKNLEKLDKKQDKKLEKLEGKKKK